MMDWKKLARLLRIQTSLVVISMTVTIILLFAKTLNDDAAGAAYKVILSSITNLNQEEQSQHQPQQLPPPKLLFGPESCLSRQESPSYRTTQSSSSNKPPSPYLLSKLRAYEHLHHRCGPYTAAYNLTVQYLLSSINNNDTITGIPTTDCSYLIWYPFNGLGNRIISLASSFLYALLTDRILLLNLDTDMSDLFCQPFPYSSWILPNDFPYKDLTQLHHLPSFHSVIASMQRNNWVYPFSVPPAIHAYLEHIPSKTRFFHCDESHHILKKIPVLILTSDVYFVPSLYMTPTFQPELAKMFPQKETTPMVFHHLAHYMLLPSNQAWKLITHYYNTHLSQADVKVGLQIRIFNPKSISHDTMLNQILACTQTSAHILPIVNPLQSANTSEKSIAILVASLYPNFAAALRSLYNNTQILGVYQPSNEGQQRFRDKSQNIKAWVEMYLLSLCDELVISPRSTFGYVAKGIGGVQSYVLMMRNESTKACDRSPTIDPCFHGPPVFNCATKRGVHSVSDLFENIEICEDYPDFGIRLSYR